MAGFPTRGGAPGSGRSRGRHDGPASQRQQDKQHEQDKPLDPETAARAICLRMLTGQPRTRHELAAALRKREIPEEAAEHVLTRFEEVGLIDDAAYAAAWVDSRHTGRGLGKRALAQELRFRGVDGEVAAEALARLEPEQEEETARTLVSRKIGSTRGLPREKRIRRLAGMLARRGYPEGLALRLVRQALDEEAA